MKESFKELLLEIEPYHKLLLTAFIIIEAALIFVEFFLKINLSFPILLVGIFILLYLFGTKDIYENNKGNRMLLTIIFWITLISFFAGLIFAIVDQKIIAIILLIAIFISPVIFYIYTREPEKKKSIEKIYDYNFWESKLKDEDIQGSVVIGYDKDTGEKIIIPYSDRFLHMLILGATGTGKTSQILTPMILQDIRNSNVGVIILEPKGDLAEQVWALGKAEGRKTLYFDPEYKNCPYFNPLVGDEDDVTENLVTTFKILNPDSSTFFQDQAEQLVRHSCKVLKRLLKDDATFIDMNILITNPNQEGTNMIKRFLMLSSPTIGEAEENKRIANWFLHDYYTGLTGDRSATKTFEHCSSVRAQILKLISHRYLKNVLNPPSHTSPDYHLVEERGVIDFDEVLANGEVLAMTSAQGKLRDLGKFLGFFLILQLQSATFRRPGTVNTRRGCMLYIDEFQTYANSGFSDMLTQGRSYRVASHLATQNRALIGMNSGSKAKSFLDLVSTNARNIVIFPGASYEDAKFYSLEFGVDVEEKLHTSVSRNLGWFKSPDFKESRSVKEENVERFTPTDITYRDFGEVICRIIKHNTVQRPVAVKIEFIPREVAKLIDEYLEEYRLDKEKEEKQITNQKTQNTQKSTLLILDDEAEDIKNAPSDSIEYEIDDSEDVAYADDLIDMDDIEEDDII